MYRITERYMFSRRNDDIWVLSVIIIISKRNSTIGLYPKNTFFSVFCMLSKIFKKIIDLIEQHSLLETDTQTSSSFHQITEIFLVLISNGVKWNVKPCKCLRRERLVMSDYKWQSSSKLTVLYCNACAICWIPSATIELNARLSCATVYKEIQSWCLI